MKFLIPDFNAHDATVRDGERGVSIVVTHSGLRIPIEPPPDPADPESVATMPVPRWAVDHAVGAVVKLDHDVARITSNRRLSDEGKAEELVAPKQIAVRTVATVGETLLQHEDTLTSAERERYRVPLVENSSVTAALRDFEIRTTVRSMDSEERQGLLRALNDGEDHELLLAILRSPLRTGRLEEGAARGWRSLIDRRDPAGRASLTLAFEAVQWAHRQLAHVVANLNRLHKYSREQLWANVSDKGGAAKLFGFSDEEIARLRLLDERRQRVAAR